MKVLLITDGIYPFQLGGMQKHSLILTRLLADHHIKVHLVHCGGDLYDQQAFDDLFNAEQLRYIQETHIPFPKLDAFPGHYLRENKRYSNLIFKKIREEGKTNMIWCIPKDLRDGNSSSKEKPVNGRLQWL